MSGLRWDGDMLGVAQARAGQFEVRKAGSALGLAEFHAFGWAADDDGFIADREPPVGVDMAREYQPETRELLQACAPDDGLVLAGEAVPFDHGMQQQDAEIRLDQRAFWVVYLHAVERVAAG